VNDKSRPREENALAIHLSSDIHARNNPTNLALTDIDFIRPVINLLLDLIPCIKLLDVHKNILRPLTGPRTPNGDTYDGAIIAHPSTFAPEHSTKHLKKI